MTHKTAKNSFNHVKSVDKLAVLIISTELLWSYCKFFNFQYGGRTPNGFFVRMRGATSKVELLVFITVQNLD